MWYKKYIESQVESPVQQVESIQLSNGEVIPSPTSLLIYRNSPRLDDSEIIGVFAGAEQARRLVEIYDPSIIKDVLKIVSDGGPYGKYVPGETEAFMAEIRKVEPYSQMSSGPIIHVNISRIVSEATSKAQSNPDGLGWYALAVLETAETIVHESTHAGGADEGGAQAAEKRFRDWAQNELQNPYSEVHRLLIGVANQAKQYNQFVQQNPNEQ
jgi:hypothetical protein